jgi:SAM-dependent methyltransferase
MFCTRRAMVARRLSLPLNLMETPSSCADFYDRLAPFYHLLYGDWYKAVSEQGEALSLLLGELGVFPGQRIHDAACGIGTQSIGLLNAGYQLSASDISSLAVDRFNTEVTVRKLTADAWVDDLRFLTSVESDSMAAVIACDNSLPHLLTDEEILISLQAMHRCLRPDGVVILSVRDYASIERKSPDVKPYGMRYQGTDRFMAVQVWEWEGERYVLRMYLTTESADGTCRTEVLKSHYYAISIEKVISLMRQAGFDEVSRNDSVLFQPVLTGRKSNAA